jgi:hypothetical protein
MFSVSSESIEEGALESVDERTIKTSRGKARCKIPLPGVPTVGIYCTGKVQAGKDHAF